MRLAVSNLVLPAGDHASLLGRLRGLGVAGLDVAPHRVWAGAWPEAGAVTAYRRAVEAAGLEIVGLHALLDDRPDLGLFLGAGAQERTVDALVRLSALCRDLGGRTLIFGAGRRRGAMPGHTAWAECRDVLERLLPRIEDHGTLLCFEPLGPSDTDFCNTARECRFLADHMDHPSLGFQLNARAQIENNDTGHSAFAALRGRLNHFHANEPGLAALGSSGRVDHADFRRHLAANTYEGWVTLVQRESPGGLAGLDASIAYFSDCYLREDNRSLRLRATDRATDDAGNPAADTRRLQLIDTAIADMRTTIQLHGGDLELDEVAGDTVRVRLSGACVDCGMAGQTLGGLRQRLTSMLGTPVRVLPALQA
jgi:sugar phosphate isomerase/epimerase/Fe-S cluster biogenesis protein NfuA